MMRRGVLLLVIAGAIALLAGCAGDPIDEAMLPTRVPELDMQALVRNAEAARPTPRPTSTNTPIPAPVPVDSDAEDAADAPSEADESVVINNGDPVVRSESPETTEKEDAQPAAEKVEAVTGGSEETTEAGTSDVVTATVTTTVAVGIETDKSDPVEEVQDTEIPDSLMAAIEDADLEQGEQLTLSTGCTSCHSMDPNQIAVGPTWYNLSATSANRVEGESAEYYIYKSIITHDAYIVEGFENSSIPPNYKETFSEQQIADIIGYLLSQRVR